MPIPTTTTTAVGGREGVDVAASIIAIRQEVGAMRAEISARLEKVSTSTSGFDRRLLDIEGSFMNHVNARLDSLCDGVTSTHLDIQGLALDIDQAHDRVCTSLDEVRSEIREVVQDSHKATSGRIDGLSKAVIDSNGRTKHAFFEVGRGLDANHQTVISRLDSMNKDIKSTVCNKIDNANGNINKLVVDSRDDLYGRLELVQQEVESSRRRITERMNTMHEALAGIMNTMRDRVFQKFDRVSSSLSSMLPVMRDIRKGHKRCMKDEIELKSFLDDHDPVRGPDVKTRRNTPVDKKPFESILRFRNKTSP